MCTVRTLFSKQANLLESIPSTFPQNMNSNKKQVAHYQKKNVEESHFVVYFHVSFSFVYSI